MVVTFNLDPDSPSDTWEDDEGQMGSLIGLRAELLRGDLRVLYIGWLISRGVNDEIIDANGRQLEPPVPAGLQELSAAQQAFADFFEVDQDLLTAAAAASPTSFPTESDSDRLANWISKMAASKKNEYLLRVFRGAGVEVAAELNNRFTAEAKKGDSTTDPPRRTVAQLQELAKNIRAVRKRQEQDRRDAAKKRKLDDLLSRLPDAWREVESHADTKKVNHYDLAVAVLVDIHELAKRGDVPDFGNAIAEFRARHSTKRALLERLDRARVTG